YLAAPLLPGGRRDRCLVELPAGTRETSNDGWRTLTKTSAPARTVAADAPELAGSILLTDTGATSLTIEDHDARLAARVSVAASPEPFPVWVVWSSAPDAPYICLEPWTDFPNALNRPGTRTLGPGNVHRTRMEIHLDAI